MMRRGRVRMEEIEMVTVTRYSSAIEDDENVFEDFAVVIKDLVGRTDDNYLGGIASEDDQYVALIQEPTENLDVGDKFLRVNKQILTVRKVGDIVRGRQRVFLQDTDDTFA